MEHYDLCIIGAGPSGYAAAMRAVDFGKKVALIERKRLGGAGIYDGALASKTMWEFSQKIKNVRDEMKLVDIDVSFKDAKDVVEEAIFERKTQLLCQLRLISKDSRLITYIKGNGSFVSPNIIHIKHNDGKESQIYAEKILIATGSRPRDLPDIKADEETILTSDGILHLNEFPKSMVILGAGVIGCEYATMFSNFGKTKVYIIDKADRILPFEDQDISDVVTSNLEKNGVTVHNTSKLIRLEKKNDGIEYEIEQLNGDREIINVEKALLSVGRAPNIENLNLDAAGVKYNERGIIIPDNDTQTNIPHIHAVGDSSGHIALVAVGERESRHAVISLFANFKAEPIHYKIISTIMFLNPEVASVGINEQMAIKHNIPVRIAKVDYSIIARAIAMRKPNGFFKLIVSDDNEMRVLGMRAVGEHASSAIQAVSLLLYMGKGIDELSTMVYPHPSIVEGIQYCCRLLLGKSTFRPDLLPDKVKCYRLHNNLREPIFNTGNAGNNNCK